MGAVCYQVFIDANNIVKQSKILDDHEKKVELGKILEARKDHSSKDDLISIGN